MVQTRLLVALSGLLGAQFLHGLAPPPADAPDTGSIVGLVGGAGFLAATVVALWWVRRDDRRGSRLAMLIGIAVPVSFLLYHGAWFDSPVTNPYWGDGSATGLQQATLVPIVAASLWVAALASQTQEHPATS